MSDFTERTPKAERGWTSLGYIGGAKATGWRNGKLRVLSALDDTPVGPQWMVSVIGPQGRSPKPREVERALLDFGMVGAAEVRGHGTVARRFTLVCDPDLRHILPKGATMIVATPVQAPPQAPAAAVADIECKLCRSEPLTGTPCRVHRTAVTPRSSLVSGLVRA